VFGATPRAYKALTIRGKRIKYLDYVASSIERQSPSNSIVIPYVLRPVDTTQIVSLVEQILIQWAPQSAITWYLLPSDTQQQPPVQISTTCWKVGSLGLRTYQTTRILILSLSKCLLEVYRREYRLYRTHLPNLLRTSNPILTIPPFNTPLNFLDPLTETPLPFYEPLRTVNRLMDYDKTLKLLRTR